LVRIPASDIRMGTQVARGTVDIAEDSIIAATRGRLTTTLAAGAAAGTLSAAFAMSESRARRQDPTRPLNAVSHIVRGGRPPANRGRNGVNTVLGSALHFGASLFWAWVQAIVCGRSLRSPSRLLASSAVTAAIAYVVDYHVVNARFRPGFEVHLPKRALFGVYASFALGLVLGGLLSSKTS
jgi:hypothetical protein